MKTLGFKVRYIYVFLKKKKLFLIVSSEFLSYLRIFSNFFQKYFQIILIKIFSEVSSKFSENFLQILLKCVESIQKFPLLFSNTKNLPKKSPKIRVFRFFFLKFLKITLKLFYDFFIIFRQCFQFLYNFPHNIWRITLKITKISKKFSTIMTVFSIFPIWIFLEFARDFDRIFSKTFSCFFKIFPQKCF